MTKAKYLVEAKTTVSQLDKNHDFVPVLVLGEEQKDFVPSIRTVVQLPLSFQLEVIAESVSDAETVAHNSLDPLFEFEVHSVRRL